MLKKAHEDLHYTKMRVILFQSIKKTPENINNNLKNASYSLHIDSTHLCNDKHHI